MKTRSMTQETVKMEEGTGPSKLITDYITGLADWRGDVITRIRKLILETDPGVTEEWKWGTPVWSRKGLICSAGVFKDHVKLNFFKGASLKDPQDLFNAGLEAKATRAIDFSQGGVMDEAALKNLIREAIAFNLAGG